MPMHKRTTDFFSSAGILALSIMNLTCKLPTSFILVGTTNKQKIINFQLIYYIKLRSYVIITVKNSGNPHELIR